MATDRPAIDLRRLVSGVWVQFYHNGLRAGEVVSYETESGPKHRRGLVRVKLADGRHLYISTDDIEEVRDA